MTRLRIGDVADRAGVPTTTVRYYERIGLVMPSARSEGGYRLYTEQVVDELRFIRRAQTIGFSLPEITELLRLSRAGLAPCSQVTALARQHLAALDDRLKRLSAFRRQLDRACASWENGRCGFTARGLCELIDVDDSPFPDERPARPKRKHSRDCQT